MKDCGRYLRHLSVFMLSLMDCAFQAWELTMLCIAVKVL